MVAGEYAWMVNTKEAVTKLIVGPDPMTAADDDKFVVPNPDSPQRLIAVDSKEDAIQDFITLARGQYAVIHNPVKGTTGVGTVKPGKNDMAALDYGAKRNVTQGHFPVWPGQQVEVRNVHHLSSNEYLVAIVESLEIDTESPYYPLLKQCAKIKEALVEEHMSKPNDPGTEVQSEGKDPGEDEEDESQVTPDDASTPSTEAPQTSPSDLFEIGQRIIIPGSLTPTFAPPSGIDVVTDEDAANFDLPEETPTITPRGVSAPESSTTALYAAVDRGDLNFSNVKHHFSQAGLNEDYLDVESKLHGFHRRGPSAASEKSYLKQVLGQDLTYDSQADLVRILSTVSPSLRPTPKALEKMVDTAVRQAVVLGPTEYCVLYDEEGKPKTHKDGRVFPGPYDRFQTTGSRDRIYDAYHLRSDRGILLRIVANELTQAALAEQLPTGAHENGQISKSHYTKGDEVFIGGFDAYLVPGSDVEVINPLKRTVHIGNDHDNIYVKAIGVDQKSGVYVQNVDTGNVELRRGEDSLLLDPRKEVHIKRRVPGDMWNLIIGKGEPHKKVDPHSMVETPWALSVVIPSNESVLISSRDGSRPVVGPKTELLEYEEVLEVLTLSRGRPCKDDKDRLETCFLRVTGSRVSDQVTLETADFVELVVKLSYGVEFVGDDPDSRRLWFIYKDYIKLMCHSCRSRLRAASKTRTLTDILNNLAEFIRDTLLRPKDEEAEHRPGLLFTENNLIIKEVDLVEATLTDARLSDIMEDTNNNVVTRQLEDARLKSELASDKLRADISKEQALLKEEQLTREQGLNTLKVTIDRDLTKERHVSALAAEANHDEVAARTRERVELGHAQNMEHTTHEHESAKSFWNDIVDIRVKGLAGESAAIAEQMKAIEPGLIEAINGLGDKQVLMEAAKSLPPASGELGIALGGLGNWDALVNLMSRNNYQKALAEMKSGASAQDVRDAATKVVESQD